MTTIPAETLPYAMTAKDGLVSLFIPAASEVRVCRGERGTAVYLPPEAWQSILDQLAQRLPRRTDIVPSAN